MSADRIARRGAAVAAIGVLVVVAGGVGAAVASSGGVFILGVHNSSFSPTSLSNRKGVALALTAKAGHPALTVNTTSKVKHLNSSLLDGLSASSLQTSGSAAATNYPLFNGSTIAVKPTMVASTGKLKKGIYYVTATALLAIPDVTNEAGLCAVSTKNLALATDPLGQSESEEFGQAATLTETLPVSVSSGQRITEFCWVDGGSATDSGFGEFAGITAIRVDNSLKGKVAPSHEIVAIRKGK
jgi:hypothetical protein